MNGPRAAARRRARTRKKRKTRAPVRNVPSYVSTSSASGMPISPVPSDTSAFGPGGPQPYMRETIVSTAASSTVVGGAGKHHSSWRADAVLDPFVDPVPPVAERCQERESVRGPGRACSCTRARACTCGPEVVCGVGGLCVVW